MSQDAIQTRRNNQILIAVLCRCALKGHGFSRAVLT
jgi:hypothetical protein